MSLAIAIERLPKILGKLMGIAAVWRDQRMRLAGATVPAVAFLSLASIAGIGIDERRTTFDESQELAEFRDTIVCRRKAILRVAIESYDAGLPAVWYAEELRNGLQIQSTIDAFDAIEWSAQIALEADDPGDPISEKVVTSSVLEIPCTFTTTREDLEGYTYIASISGTATMITDGETEVEFDFAAEIES